jgi:branched-chain amino acid transport system ATP-binding protein
MSVLRVEALSKKFGGVNAVEDLSFDIQPGAVYSIIGPNGAGKTTLLNLLSGVYQPSGGRIAFWEHELTGRAPANLPAHRYVQNLQVFFHMSALGNVMVGAICERCGIVYAAALARLAHARPAGRRRPRSCASACTTICRRLPPTPCPTAR